MEDCIFCKIAMGKIPSNIVYEDEKIICFYDLSPMAKKHVLIVPKEHLDSLNNTCGKEELLGYMLSKVEHIASLLKIKDDGYRVIINTGNDAGQTVKHLHIHVLGGEKLTDKLV